MAKEQKQPTLRDMVAGVFSAPPPKKKTYAQIVSKFSETRNELQELVSDSDTNIADIETQIAELEVEKTAVVEEKSNAMATLDFLDKFIK